MPTLHLPKPLRSELERIEGNLRLEAAATGKEPQSVRQALGDEAKKSAWRGEALRFWYLVKKKEREGVK